MKTTKTDKATTRNVIMSLAEALACLEGIRSEEPIHSEEVRTRMAVRRARRKIDEAKGRLEIAKIRRDDGLPADEQAAREAALESAMADARAQMALEDIQDGLRLELPAVANLLPREDDILRECQELRGREVALAERLAELEARDTTGFPDRIQALHNEAERIKRLIEDARIFRRNKGYEGDDPDEIDPMTRKMWRNELAKLQEEGRYEGELTEEGATTRLEKVKQEMMALESSEIVPLDRAEYLELTRLPTRLAETSQRLDALAPLEEKIIGFRWLHRQAVAETEAVIEAHGIEAECRSLTLKAEALAV